MLFITRILISFLFVTACSPGPKGQSSSSASAASKSKGSEFIKVELQAPEKLGGHWTRLMILKVPNGKNWQVERKLDGETEWTHVDYTDERGVFHDKEYANQKAQYRFGKLYESEELQPQRDFIWTQKSPKTARIFAYRVIVPKEEILFLEKAEVLVESEIFQLEGHIQAYPETATGGENAGKLTIRAEVLTGSGTIRLHGMKGRPGAKGAMGLGGREHVVPHAGEREEDSNGKRGGTGGPGGAGGRGGDLKIYTSDPSTVPFICSVNGGPGGDGGQGGDPGTPGSRWMNHTESHWIRGSWGEVGHAGPVGLGGDNGTFTVSKKSR